MGDKTNILKKFGDLVLSQEDCQLRDPLKTELVELKYGAQSLGPFHPDDIRHLVKHSYLDMSEVWVKRIHGQNLNEWRPFYEHPFFSRRRPTLVPEEVLATDDDASTSDQYYILKQGIKTGPFKLQEIISMLNTHELLLTDMLSIDGGISFGKVCELSEFDRRNQMETGELPHLPEKELFSQSTVEAMRDARHNIEEQLTIDAVANLAFFGNIKSLKDNHPLKNPTPHNDEIALAKSSHWPKVFFSLVTIFSLFGIYSLMSSNSLDGGREIANLNKSREKNNGERVPANTKNNQGKKIQIRGAQEIEPEYIGETESGNPPVVHKLKPINTDSEETHYRDVPSFRESKAFRAGNKAKRVRPQLGENREDDFDYDDGHDPVELDPIRSQVSRETLNPIGVNEDYEEAHNSEVVDPYAQKALGIKALNQQESQEDLPDEIY